MLATLTSPESSPGPTASSSTSAPPATPATPYEHLLQARHRSCIWPGCTIASKSCQIHHIDHATCGGPTRLDNLAPTCAYHHRLLHEGGYSCTRNNDRTTLSFTRPDGTSIGQTAMNPSLT